MIDFNLRFLNKLFIFIFIKTKKIIILISNFFGKLITTMVVNA